MKNCFEVEVFHGMFKGTQVNEAILEIHSLLEKKKYTHKNYYNF